MLRVHGTAIIGEGVVFGEGVTVGPYAVVEDGVCVGNGSSIASHAILRSGTVIGENCMIDSFAAIGGLPQDESFDGKFRSSVSIGNGTTIREFVTVNRSTEQSVPTKVGANCMLQASAHVAHDCEIGDGTVMAVGSMLGGRVSLGKMCFIGGGAAVHQRVVLGDCVILSGNSATALDIPPYAIAAGISMVIGVNITRLQRMSLPRGNIVAVKNCFREFYKRTGIFRERAEKMLREGFAETGEVQNFLNFFLRESKMGFAPKRRSVK
ncbi:MAG: acyl-ACP--UDP-N-acetylglucosamine O-acyltransferase [Puniceicoccales bacterium]|jgi:UDP-N-acetylglucosamine acyltransferase|nr:acyl-ACP--UDP-N-acetylglucosamine O-acyltransferase [Puniceicoccales bacterium]